MMNSEARVPLVSIVIPMYNCEIYLDELLGSMSRQSFSDFEAICVNDGSTDGTEDKLKELCAEDERFKWISKENGGAWSARNAGLDVAKGKYVLFLDADDLYSEDLLKDMVGAAEAHQADVTICTFKWSDNLIGVEIERAGLYGPFVKQDTEDGIIAIRSDDIPNLFQCTNPGPQNKMYKREFLKSIDLKYPPIAVAEDLVFTYSALSVADRIVGVRKKLLEIRTGHNDGSLTSNRNRHIMDAISAVKLLYKWLESHGVAKKYKDTYLRRAAGAIRYEMNFCYSEEYLEKALQMFTSEEPWTNITHAQLTGLMKPDSATEEVKLKKLEQESEKHGDGTMLNQQAFCTKNRMESMQFLEKGFEQHRPAISVIVPVYNCKEFLEDLLSDIKGQTFDSFEAIFIDDGSDDGTIEYLQDECRKDVRFTCVPIKHAGAGAARNKGLDIASGSYIMFFDADDRYSHDLLKEMYDAAIRHDVDEVFCLYDEYNYMSGSHRDNIGVYLPQFPDDTRLKTSEIDNMLCCVGWGPTNALFKKEIIDRYHLRFSTTHVSNDVFFIYAYAAATDSMVCIHKHLLTVRRYVNSTSLTSSRWKHTEDVVTTLKELYTWLESNGFDELYRETFMQACRYSIGYNTTFVYNQKYVNAITDFICRQSPFKDIDDETFYKKYWSDFDITKLKKQLSNKKKENTETAALDAQKISNQILSVQAIEQLAWEKHGRVLNPNTSVGKASVSQKRIAELELKIKKLRKSKSFRIGSFIMRGPRAAKRSAKRVKRSLKRQKPKVSVILPVYNVEEYITECIDSLIKQTMKELEFIFIDDCSADGSMKIVEKYKRKDPRIKAIYNKKNMGAGPTRNRGIKIAKGDYLSFIDPDDWVDKDFYRRLYKTALTTSADVVKGSVHWFDQNGKDVTPALDKNYNKQIVEGLKKGWPLYRVFCHGHWSAIYAKKLFEDGSVCYGDYRRGQDGVFTLRLGIKTNDISICDEAIYHYRRRTGSASRNISYEGPKTDLETLKERIEVLLQKGLEDIDYDYLAERVDYCAWTFYDYIKKSGLSNERRRDETRAFIDRLEKILERADGFLEKVERNEIGHEKLKYYHQLKDSLEKTQ